MRLSRTFALAGAVLICGLSGALAVHAGVFDGRGTPSDPRELRLAACQKYIEGEYDEARNFYQQAIDSAEKTYGEKSSFVADLYYEAGSLSLEDGNFPKADKFLGAAVKRKPNSTMARVKYAELLTMQGQTGEALVQIQEALKRNPGAPEAQHALVKWMMAQASQSDTRTPKGAIASLASTIESYKLSNMGRTAAENAHARIARWGDKKLPPVQINDTAVAIATPPPPTGLEALRRPAEPAAAKSEEPPKVEAKQPEPPKPKKVVAAKPKPAKPKIKPKQSEPKPKRRERPVEAVANNIPPPPPMSFGVSGGGGGKKAKGGVLVPPPPPLMPVFSSAPPPPSSGFELKTKVRIQSDKEPAVKKPKPARPPVIDQDKEFEDILDWAEVDKKKKTKSVP